VRDNSIDRLYRLLPEYLRARDADEGRPLQALMQVLGRELETVESDIDDLYDDWFIETCEDWAVQYIGDLVGARALRDFGQGALRAYVANTLSYRQAKGTLAVTEQLARDVTGWAAVGVEFFRRLAQTQNINRVRLDNLTTVSLRDADAASLTGGPFETATHSIDVRDISRDRGRYNIPNLGLFVWRIQSYDLSFLKDRAQPGRLGGVEPRISPLGSGYRLLDPVGRPLHLFNRVRTEQGVDQLTTEASVPAPLRRRRLADDLRGGRARRRLQELAALPGPLTAAQRALVHELTREAAVAGATYFQTRPVFAARLGGVDVPVDKLAACNLADQPGGWTRPASRGDVHFDPELGRVSLHPDDEGKTLEVAYAYGAPHDIGAGPADRRTSVAGWIAPFTADIQGAPLLWQLGVSKIAPPNSADPIVDTLAAAIAAWNAIAQPGQRGIIAMADNATYDDDLTDSAHHIEIPAGAMLAIVAAGWPPVALGNGGLDYHPGTLVPQGRRPHVKSDLHVHGSAASNETAGTLIVDGLLLEGGVVVEDGDLGRLDLRYATLGAGSSGLGPGVTVVAGNSRLGVTIDHTISGSIELGEVAGTVTIGDSIIGEDRVADGNAIASPVVLAAESCDLQVERTTVFGRLTGRTIEGDDSIFVGPIDIKRRQSGCIRFSYVHGGSRSPRRFHCAPDLQIAEAKERLGAAFGVADEQAIRERVQPVFTATVSEDYAFGQLARRCPTEIASGAEGGAEMGAMNGLFAPMRLANIGDALGEYLPFGLSAGVIFAT
jgi:hypothetical protein